MTSCPKNQPLRSRSYLDLVRTMPCFFTGFDSVDTMAGEAVDPAHIGITGLGIKSPDWKVIPLIHSLHDLQTKYGWRQAFVALNPERQADILERALECVGAVLFLSARHGFESAEEMVEGLK